MIVDEVFEADAEIEGGLHVDGSPMTFFSAETETFAEEPKVEIYIKHKFLFQGISTVETELEHGFVVGDSLVFQYIKPVVGIEGEAQVGKDFVINIQIDIQHITITVADVKLILVFAESINDEELKVLGIAIMGGEVVV